MRENTITIVKINEVWGKVVSTDSGVMEAIYKEFSVFAYQHWFNPKFKLGVWDGKLHFVQRNGDFPLGLFKDIVKFCKCQRDYELQIDPLFSPEIEDKEEFMKDFLEVLDTTENLPFIPRKYQVKGSMKAIFNKRAIIEHGTGSGKSFTIYLTINYLRRKNPNHRVLILVPKIDLITQFHDDLVGYGCPIELLGKYYGEEKQLDAPITIGTWQSLKNNKAFLKNFTVLIVDECHGQKADVVRSVAEGAINTQYRLGFTGTMPEEDKKAETLQIIGTLGPVVDKITTEELQKLKMVSQLKINIPYIEYSDDETRDLKQAIKILMKQKKPREAYQLEKTFTQKHVKRNEFIGKITKKMLGLDRNVLILVNKLDHVDTIVEALKAMDITPFVVTGQVKDTEERNDVRKKMELSGGNVIVATSGVYSTGISINRLHCVIFADPGKSKITTLQSVGRGLRLHETKDKLYLFDVSDNLMFGNKHLEKRMEFYARNNFDVEIKEISFA
jgi:superfamily II DNA or RNA helicase